MRDIDTSGIDLNLLTALDALLEEASVTAAAKRMGVGQPAASHALGRLRELLGDPLLVRSGRTMMRTPRAEALREPLRDLLGNVTRLLRDDDPFEPASTTRSFRILAPDLLLAMFTRVTARLGQAAPRARLEILGRLADEPLALEQGRADLALVPTPLRGPNLRMRSLGVVRFAVVARRGHPITRRRPGIKAWTAYPHVIVQSGSNSSNVVAAALESVRVPRDIGLVVPSFFAALVAVSDSDLLFTAPRELVLPLIAKLGLEILPTPIRIPSLPVAAVWHERFDADPGHRFFRGLVIDEVAQALRDRGHASS